jgi:hypothetical protein
MHPVPTDHILNYDFTSHYYWKSNRSTTKYRDLEDEWVRVDSSAVESGSRKTKSIVFDGEESNCNGAMIKWMDCTSASGDLLPIVIIIRLDSDEMPDPTAPMLFMKIPGLNSSSPKDIQANETVGWVVFLKPGASMINFHLIIHEHFKLIREQRLKLTVHSNITDDECMRFYMDSDMINVKFLMDATNMAKS